MILQLTDRDSSVLLDQAKLQTQRILAKSVTRLSKALNPNNWNYYHRTKQSPDKKASLECRGIRFIGSNLTAITQPTGIHSSANPLAEVLGGIYFKRTSYCPAQTLCIGQYLTWDGKCFRVFDDNHFQSIYEHR